MQVVASPAQRTSLRLGTLKQTEATPPAASSTESSTEAQALKTKRVHRSTLLSSTKENNNIRSQNEQLSNDATPPAKRTRRSLRRPATPTPTKPPTPESATKHVGPKVVGSYSTSVQDTQESHLQHRENPKDVASEKVTFSSSGQSAPPNAKLDHKVPEAPANTHGDIQVIPLPPSSSSAIGPSSSSNQDKLSQEKPQSQGARSPDNLPRINHASPQHVGQLDNMEGCLDPSNGDLEAEAIEAIKEDMCFGDMDLDDITEDMLADWDQQERLEASKSDIPDNACPICSIDLEALTDMTPAAHVNRCLDNPQPTTPVRNLVESTAPIQGDQLAASISTSTLSTSTQLRTPTASAKTSTLKSNTRSASQSKKPCPFYKKMPDTPFAVDAFSYGAIPGISAYLLTHFHSDHYTALSSTWSHGLIYCSSITATLVVKRLKVKECYIRRLPMYTPTVVDGITVQLIDANHCPGSVLFVFDLPNPRRRYLHTGDFRASADMLVHPILSQPNNPTIDILYLDTTYMNPTYSFPPQDYVIRETARFIAKELGVEISPTSANPSPKPAVAAVAATSTKKDIMGSWLKKLSSNAPVLDSILSKPATNGKGKSSLWQKVWNQSDTGGGKTVVCVGTYLIGKERVFIGIAKALGTKIFALPAKMAILECLEDDELLAMLTDNPQEAQVHLVGMNDLSPESLQAYLDKLGTPFTHLIGIRPTGWTFRPSRQEAEAVVPSTPQPIISFRPSFTSATVKIYPTPYSEHSSFAELESFVRGLSIHKVIPTVGVGSEKSRNTMTEYIKKWEAERARGIGWTVPVL